MPELDDSHSGAESAEGSGQFTQAAEVKKMAEASGDKPYPSLSDDIRPQVMENWDMAKAGDKVRTSAARDREWLAKHDAETQLLDEYRTRYQALQQERRATSSGSEEQAGVHKKMDELVDEAMAKLARPGFQDGGDASEQDRESERSHIREALAGYRGDSFHNEFQPQERERYAEQSKNDIAEKEARADSMEEVAQALHRHPEVVSDSGSALGVADIFRMDHDVHEARQQGVYYESQAKEIEGSAYSHGDIWEAINQLDRGQDGEATRADVEALRAMYKDDSTTLGELKAKAAAILHEQAEPYLSQATSLQDKLKPVYTELAAIRAAKQPSAPQPENGEAA